MVDGLSSQLLNHDKPSESSAITQSSVTLGESYTSRLNLLLFHRFFFVRWPYQNDGQQKRKVFCRQIILAWFSQEWWCTQYHRFHLPKTTIKLNAWSDCISAFSKEMESVCFMPWLRTPQLRICSPTASPMLEDQHNLVSSISVRPYLRCGLRNIESNEIEVPTQGGKYWEAYEGPLGSKTSFLPTQQG